MEAFGRLFSDLYPSMCMVALKFVNDQDAAEDLAQNAFVRLWEKRTHYQSIPCLKTFLYVTVKHLCFNHLRNKKETIDFMHPEVILLEDYFSDTLLEEEAFRILDRAIESLAPQSARIMKLVAEGKQNKEIAETLNISVSTVKTLKYNAVETLRKKIKNYYALLFIIDLI